MSEKLDCNIIILLLLTFHRHEVEFEVETNLNSACRHTTNGANVNWVGFESNAKPKIQNPFHINFSPKFMEFRPSNAFLTILDFLPPRHHVR